MLHGPEVTAKSQKSHTLWLGGTARQLPWAQSFASALPQNRSCHTWLLHGAPIKYPIHYVHSIPWGDWNKKLFWQKSWGNETRGRWGKRKRKIEIKNRKKPLNQVDGMNPELLTAQELKEKRKWTPGHIVRLKVYLVCVSQKGQVIDLNHGLRKETLFPTKKESHSI